MKEQKRRQDDQRHAAEMDIVLQQQIRRISSFKDVIKEEIRDISTELFLLEATTENVMNQVLLEMIMCMEKEIV